jgi:hypothetical protein
MRGFVTSNPRLKSWLRSSLFLALVSMLAAVEKPASHSYVEAKGIKCLMYWTERIGYSKPAFRQSWEIRILKICFHNWYILVHWSTVKVRLSDNSSIGKVALAAYFHRAHYNSPMALAAYFHRTHYNSPIALAAYFHRAHYNSPIALAAYFHRTHYNSPMALAAYFCRYPASRGISRAVSKVSECSTGGAAPTDQLTRRPRLVFITAHIKIVYRRSPFSLTAESIYLSAHPLPQACRINELLLHFVQLKIHCFNTEIRKSKVVVPEC